MKIRAVETGLFHENRRIDRRTDMTKLIVAFRNFVKVLNNVEDRGSTVFKVLCYKSEGRCFDPRWCNWNFSLT